MLQRHEAREHLDPAGLDGEVVITAAKGLAAIFHDAQSATLRSIVRCQLLQTEHAVGDAVRGLVERVSREIVKGQYSGALANEVVLDR